jgi:hypothetical protein
LLGSNGVVVERVGTIEPGSDSKTGRSEWLRLIGTHPQLSQVPPRQGVNPFSRGGSLYEAAPDAARVIENADDVGLIHWGMDDSRCLVVWSSAGSEAAVKRIAEDIAAQLEWHFVAHAAA